MPEMEMTIESTPSQSSIGHTLCIDAFAQEKEEQHW